MSSKITGFTENTTPATSDLLVMVDDPSGSPATQKITLANLLKVIASLTELTAGPATTDELVISDAGTPKRIDYSDFMKGVANLTELAVAPADTDEFLVLDAGVPKRIDASLVGGGGGGSSTLTNKSGGQVVQGDVVVFDFDNDSAFTTTTNAQDRRVIGVANATIANNASGEILHMGLGEILLDDNCSRGDWLIPSGTAKQATTVGPTRPNTGFVGVALEAGTADSTVTALIFTDMAALTDSATGVGYIMNGYNAGSKNRVQKLPYASETWTDIGASMPRATYRGGSGAYNNAVLYHLGGVSNLTSVSKYTIATDTGADLGTGLNGGRQEVMGLSDGADVAYCGGSSTWDRRDAFHMVSDTRYWADTSMSPSLNQYATYGGHINDGGATPKSYSGGYSNSGSFSATIHEFTLSTSTNTTASGTMNSARALLHEFLDEHGSEVYGYWAGGYSGSWQTATDKFTISTETCASVTAMSANTQDSGGISSKLKGYAIHTTETRMLAFATDTWADLGSANSQAVYACTGHEVF